ncbi:hypothetical protein FS749_013733 [Ceratobasidium sp. UAMH 11750]|nr:hypothetical protein FS749_013733 [Ceratobasidium sp. UAMH 11750]
MTSKSSARSKAPNDLGDDDQPSSEVDPIEEELKADEAACAYLIRKITARDKTRNVKYLDLHELETIWERMQREPAPALKKNPKVQTLGTVELTTSSAPSKSKSATTATAKRPLPKQAAQNPVRSGDPARSAPSKSATATASKNNSRDKSDQPLLPPKSAKPAAKSAASSSVPRTAYSKAKPPPMTPGVHYEEIPLDDESDADETFGGINQGDDDQGDDDQGDDHGEEEAPVGVKAKKSKNNCKATKDYTDPVLQNLISVVCEHLIPKALKVGLCIPPAKLDPLIHECWNLGLEELQLENSQYSCTHQNRETIKTRLQSNRSHARNRAFITAPAIFGFHGKPLKEQAASAAKLLPSEFLRNPEAETGGKFQHPFIAGLLAHCLLKGRKPPGERYPEYFRVMPLESIAFACAMMQYALEQIQLGAPKQDKLDFAKYQTRFSTHLHSLQTFQKERPTLVGTIQKKLWITIMESVGKEDQLADPSEPPLGALTAHDFDDEEEPTPEELAALDMGASRVAKAEPSCHATHTGKGKGKAHGPSIDSDEEHRGVFYSGGNNVANVSQTWSPPPVRPDDDNDNGAGPGPSTSTKAHKLRDESETSETTSSESDSESTGTGSDASERRKDHKERKKRKEHRAQGAQGARSSGWA